ncbi:chymotrypsin-C-like [Rhynchophorus ferrugineus]|uniref:Peptidase S1 domain-containing protein n=1 Tax=Rhynchophorus ferrugineus TaxID=354439 RepID=A0A834IT41_RHYFE|nr:hypothetical protein GWI33_004646 [Rhynchophorus ferrugineus]
MFLACLVTCLLFAFTIAQQLVSPCPDVLRYEINPSEPDRWYAIVNLKTEAELNGVWFRVLLNKETIQLGNWFGEVETRDNNTGYLIKNPGVKLMPGSPIQLRFYVRFNPNEPVPFIKTLRLNARQICPVGGTTTAAPISSGQLFTNKPEININNSPGFSPPIIERPDLPPSEDDDFYQGDFSFILKPQNQADLLNNVACGTVIKQPRPLITHGQETSEGEFPWHAAIYHSKGIDLTYICGASLISKLHLITVAHCVTHRKSPKPLSPSNLVIYLGKYYLRAWSNPGIQYRKVDDILVHPMFNPTSFSNDVALIKLSQAAKFTDFVRPICLWEGSNQLERVTNQIGTVAGWGFDETGKVTEQLTKAHMPIVSQETCIYSFPEFYSRFTSSTTFCAGFKNGTSVCNGDSGGGLILPKPGSNPNNPVWQIRGLVSISVALQNRFRCDASHFVVFTDVAKYLNFIYAALQK